MGNAGVDKVPETQLSVHPHVHGERFLLLRRLRLGFGSSPRTWGTLGFGHIHPTCIRFIPTYMGNAHTTPSRAVPAAVHPHVHGERIGDDLDSPAGCGSSPRTWGTQERGYRGEKDVRFIPTYMGNARHPPAPGSCRPVHPHVQGNARGALVYLAQNGSSPRTWGTHVNPSSDSRGIRFIPTYMGNAIGRAGRQGQLTVHPHVHGERISVIRPHR